MKTIIAVVLGALLLAASLCDAQTVAQGAGGTNPWRVSFGGISQPIICTSGCGSPPATPDLDTFTEGVTNMSPVGGVFAEGLADVVDGKQATVRMTPQRAFHVNFRDATGAELDPRNIKGATDGTLIGNIGTALNVWIGNDTQIGVNAFLHGATSVDTLTNNGDFVLIGTEGQGTATVYQTAVTGGFDGTLNFEATNNIAAGIWYAVRGTRTSDYVQEYQFTGTSLYPWKIPLAGSHALRVRLSGRTTGTTTLHTASSPSDHGLVGQGAATAAGQASVKSDQMIGAINTCQYDIPPTIPTNHFYTTPRCGAFREIHVGLYSSNGSTMGEPGGTYPLVTMFPSGSTTNTQSFTANAQTLSYSSSSADSTSKGTYVFHIQNTWVGTIEFRARVSSGDSYTAIPAVNLATGVTGTTATVPGFYALPSSWMWDINLVTTAWTSGQADVTSAISPETFANVITTPIPLSTGAATSALQTTGNTSLSSIDGKTPALGQQLAAASSPVVLTAAQLVTLTPPAAITGFATSALQTTGNSSLSSIDGKTPALGQQLAAASSPVVLTAAQLATLTPPSAITGFALETGGNLASIKTDVDKIPSQGQALAAASMPVVLTAIQASALTPPTNTGYALDSSLTTLNAKDFATQTTLALIKAKTDNLDALLSTLATQISLAAELAQVTALNAKVLQAQQLMANSLSVTIASDQTPISVKSSNNTLPPSLPCNPLRRTNCQPKGF